MHVVNPEPTENERELEVAVLLVELLQELSGPKISIENVIETIFAKASVTGSEQIPLRSPARQVLFAVIGICSMIYQPEFLVEATEQPQFRFVRHEPNPPTSLNALNICKRPVSALLREFKIVQPLQPQASSKAYTSDPLDHKDALGSSNISFAALKSACGITISWVNTLDAHLLLDPSTRTLYLFRFPSYCAATYLSDSKSFLAR